MQNNKKHANLIIPWLLLYVIAKMEESALSGLVAQIWVDLLRFWLIWVLATSLKGKNYTRTTKIASNTSVAKNVVYVWVLETVETKGFSVKELSHFVDPYH